MKIILKEEVEQLGGPGEVVDVKPGYARNYLLPRGLAEEATPGRLKEADRLREQAEERQAQQEAAARALAQKLEDGEVVLQVKAGQAGKLFGSVTGQDVAQAIREQLGAGVEKRQVELEEPLRNLGEHVVPLRLYRELVAHIRVRLEAQE